MKTGQHFRVTARFTVYEVLAPWRNAEFFGSSENDGPTGLRRLTLLPGDEVQLHGALCFAVVRGVRREIVFQPPPPIGSPAAAHARRQNAPPEDCVEPLCPAEVVQSDA